jgi:predicted ribosomally synthesized peptide with SipW-like signal peptide
VKRTILVSLLVIAVVASLVGASTWAWFSDTETSTGNKFTAGTLNVAANESSPPGTFTFDLGTISNIAPGDTTGSATITVTNVGSLNAATFGRFVLTGDSGLANALKFYEYKVEYYKADGVTPVARWASPDFDPYFGTAINMDYWVKAGVMHPTFVSYGGKDNLRDWVDGDGALDIPGASWDMEGLKSGSKYVLSFQFQMDPNAGDIYQGATVTLGYEVKATQIKKGAVLALNLGGNMPTAVDDHIAYMEGQLASQ